jgi:hypothetical protein
VVSESRCIDRPEALSRATICYGLRGSPPSPTHPGISSVTLEVPALSRRLSIGDGLALSSPLSSCRDALTAAACRDSARQLPTSIESPDRETRALACTTIFVPGALHPQRGLPARLTDHSADHAGGHGPGRTEGRLETILDVSEDIIGVSLLPGADGGRAAGSGGHRWCAIASSLSMVYL